MRQLGQLMWRCKIKKDRVMWLCHGRPSPSGQAQDSQPWRRTKEKKREATKSGKTKKDQRKRNADQGESNSCMSPCPLDWSQVLTPARIKSALCQEKLFVHRCSPHSNNSGKTHWKYTAHTDWGFWFILLGCHFCYRQLSRLAESVDAMKVLFFAVGKSHIGITVQNMPVVTQDLPLLIVNTNARIYCCTFLKWQL